MEYSSAYEVLRADNNRRKFMPRHHTRGEGEAKCRKDKTGEDHRTWSGLGKRQNNNVGFTRNQHRRVAGGRGRTLRMWVSGQRRSEIDLSVSKSLWHREIKL